jgi:Zn-dependent peptidase ImmA (M78 family)
MQNIKYQIEHSGLSNEDLAKKSGISIERIDGFLAGRDEPTMSDIRKLSKALKLSIDFLISGSEKFEKINVLFRDAIKNMNEKQKADKLSYMVGNSFSLLTEFQPNELLFGGFPSVENTYKNARLLAAKFRELFCNADFLIPLLHLPKIVSEELKCIVFVTELGKDVDGASAIINKIPFIFISPRFEPRMLFTLAHELAHIIAHHNQNEDFAKVDHYISTLTRNKSKDEGFANAFASELLLPEEGVAVTLQKIRKHFSITGNLGDVEIIYLSRIYGVSFDAAAKRCEDMKLIPTGGAASLSENLKERHGSAEKRAEGLRIPERPRIEFPKVSSSLIKSAIDKVYKGEISLGKASEILSIPFAEILKHNAHE